MLAHLAAMQDAPIIARLKGHMNRPGIEHDATYSWDEPMQVPPAKKATNPFLQVIGSNNCKMLTMAGLLDYHLAFSEVLGAAHKRAPRDITTLFKSGLKPDERKEWKTQPAKLEVSRRLLMQKANVIFALVSIKYPDDVINFPSRYDYLKALVIRKGPVAVGMSVDDEWNKKKTQKRALKDCDSRRVLDPTLQRTHSVIVKGWMEKGGVEGLIIREAKGLDWNCKGDAFITKADAETAFLGSDPKEVFYIESLQIL